MVVILKPLDEMGYLGYAVAVDGTVWSRWNTRGRLTEQWRERETILKPTTNHDRKNRSDEGPKSRYVRLKVGERQDNVLVAKLLLQAAFGRLFRFRGFKVCYKNGRPDDCRLVNLSWARHPSMSHACAFHGSQFANQNPPGFITVNI
jgi:hypothetical protein